MNNEFYNTKKSLIKEKDDIILDVNNNFINLTQFSRSELCGKNITKIFNKLFRNSNEINISDKESQAVLFTKTFEVRFINIQKFKGIDNITNVYIFNEIENSRLDDKLLFVDNLINDNKMGIGIYTANDFKLIKANQKYLSYMPKPFNTKDIIYGKCIDEFIPNFEASSAKKILINIIKNNKPAYFTELHGHILGKNDYWDITITPISENGEVKYIMSILENVSDRVLSRKHIQRKNKQLKSVIESVEDLISIVDKNGKYIKQNYIIKSLFGLNEDNNYVGYSCNVGKFYDFSGSPIPYDDLCFVKLLKGTKIKDQKLKYVYNNKEYYLNCNVIPIFDKNNQLDTGVIVIQNITELVKNNNLISKQNKELEVILNNIYDALIVIDKYGNFTRTNKALNKNLRKNHFMTTTDKLEDFILNKTKYYDNNDRELDIKDLPIFKVSKGITVKQQRVIIKNEYNKVHLEISAVPIFDEKRNFEYGIVLAHDITHIIENNNKIKHQQQLIIKTEQEKLDTIEKALAMKDEFISLISHEFKTPLNVIYSAVQLIEYAYINEMPDKAKSLIKNIKQNTFRQLRLVNNLLDITRINSGRFKLHIKTIDIVSLTKQISQSVRLYSDQKNIELIFKCSLKCKNISTDDEKLERIILNLLSNAIKFTDAGGSVTVSLNEDIKTNTIIIQITDTGLGIPKDKQELIFERFGQVDSNLSRQAEGTGIGLSLVKKLVDVLNGKIELESEPGNGSTFRITLPINEHIGNEDTNTSLFEGSNRLVNSLNVEFSDIYL
ncbi:PAS domain-containing sensor histidine kinase [Clostridium sp.]|uniref:sensor histidine kinase n=1 Tax=Clostridium sp. TaxID=1506 RepID=UPI002601E183|nr:PAS domain-containing sensor histidine kinase [Clostridium sp.]